jgi:N-acetylglutamate synthase-like GNAT family acetyltransferase
LDYVDLLPVENYHEALKGHGMMNIVIKRATLADLEWINQQYASVSFKPSTLKNEEVVLAEVDTLQVGLGRIQKVQEDVAEMGGIYVLPEYRRKGIAKRIVTELVDIGKQYSTVYCLPFAHLRGFYSKFGLKELSDYHQVPHKVLEKYYWANETYSENVLLLSR